MLEPKVKEALEGNEVSLSPERGYERYASKGPDDFMRINLVKGKVIIQNRYCRHETEDCWVEMGFGEDKFGPETKEYKAFERLSRTQI